MEFVKADPELANLPMVINTMGFNSGLGVHLMKKILKSFLPRTIVSIRSRFHSKNYSGLNFDILCPGHTFLEYAALPESSHVQSMHSSDTWGVPHPRQLRNLVITTRISRWKKDLGQFFQIRLDCLAFQVLHGDADYAPARDIPALFNATIVSLGKVDQEEIQFEETTKIGLVSKHVLTESMGFGIVQGILQDEGILTLVTDTPGDILEKVNMLSLGAVYIPEAVMTLQYESSVDGRVPYVQKRIVTDEESLVRNPLAEAWTRHSKPKNIF